MKRDFRGMMIHVELDVDTDAALDWLYRRRSVLWFACGLMWGWVIAREIIRAAM